MGIYTKTGDRGKTSLYGGKRVGKDSARIKAYGDVDELNAILGVCLSLQDSFTSKKKTGEKDGYPRSGLFTILKKLQHLLFIAGSDLAAPLEIKTERIQKTHVSEIEKLIDLHEKDLPVLRNFILPGGCEMASYLHLARTVCRRAEREIFALQKKEKINPNLLPWLNRLSDLFFVLARHANKITKTVEEKWLKPR